MHLIGNMIMLYIYKLAKISYRILTEFKESRTNVYIVLPSLLSSVFKRCCLGYYHYLLYS